jgi:hypothetical protein
MLALVLEDTIKAAVWDCPGGSTKARKAALSNDG